MMPEIVSETVAEMLVKRLPEVFEVLPIEEKDLMNGVVVVTDSPFDTASFLW